MATLNRVPKPGELAVKRAYFQSFTVAIEFLRELRIKPKDMHEIKGKGYIVHWSPV